MAAPEDPITHVEGLIQQGLVEVFRERPANPARFLARWISERSGSSATGEELPNTSALIEECNAIAAKLHKVRAGNAELELELEAALSAVLTSEASLAEDEERVQRGVKQALAAAEADLAATVSEGQSEIEVAAREALATEHRAKLAEQRLAQSREYLEQLRALATDLGLDGPAALPESGQQADEQEQPPLRSSGLIELGRDSPEPEEQTAPRFQQAESKSDTLGSGMDDAAADDRSADDADADNMSTAAVDDESTHRRATMDRDSVAALMAAQGSLADTYGDTGNLAVEEPGTADNVSTAALDDESTHRRATLEPDSVESLLRAGPSPAEEGEFADGGDAPSADGGGEGSQQPSAQQPDPNLLQVDPYSDSKSAVDNASNVAIDDESTHRRATLGADLAAPDSEAEVALSAADEAEEHAPVAAEW